MDEKEFEKGILYFNCGEYFEAHETWEGIWTDASGAERAYLQGLIQVSVAMHHARNENWGGTRKLLASALGYLEKGGSFTGTVNLEKLKDHVLDFENSVQARLKGENSVLPFFSMPIK